MRPLLAKVNIKRPNEKLESDCATMSIQSRLVIRYQVPVVPDIRAQRRERLNQGIEPGIRPVEGRDC